MRLVKAAEMQQMDRMTIEEIGIPGIVLMENAGRSAARFFLEHFTPSFNDSVVLLCGRGNNGGDGYVVARYLHQAGLDVSIAILSQLDRITGDARTNLDIIRKMDLALHEIPDGETWEDFRHRLHHSKCIVDAILGTGLNAPVRGFYRTVIDDLNKLQKPVMSIDVPSGLNADSGQVMGVAVKADLTVTFGFPKLGQVVFPGAGLVGRLVRIDIGIPACVSEKIPHHFSLTEPSNLKDSFSLEAADIHKGTRGHLLVLAGSTGKTGAAALTALGGLRAGAGLVTLGIPETLNAILEEKLTEAMTVPLPETGGGNLSTKAWGDIQALFQGKTAVALGPGLSTHPETVGLVKKVVAECPLPMVIDADGLNALAGCMDILKEAAARTILTPHPGEMSRISGLETTAIQKDRVFAATGFVQTHGCYLVLKGARSLIAMPDGRLYVNPTGSPALSSGGSGDVLTGLIGGFLARRFPPAKAAIGGPYIHGLAADLLAEQKGSTGVLAGELLQTIPPIIAHITRGTWPLTTPALHRDFYHIP
ncbi:MAG: NAD(P)H-hydrate dehydratase [Deltaproteobacteria bacterium]|nr:NAD(P)H-hydrate dehydratase [Deltaproteobacteria bacterium]